MEKFWFTLKELGVQTRESLFHLTLPFFFFFNRFYMAMEIIEFHSNYSNNSH